MTGKGRLRAGVATAALVIAPTAGCGNTQDDAVRQVASAFSVALSQHDGRAACDLLAPTTRSELEQSSGKDCSVAVTEEVQPAGDPARVSVFGTSAQVRYDGDIAFLSRFQDGWRVLAVACQPQPSGPYDCSVKGA